MMKKGGDFGGAGKYGGGREKVMAEVDLHSPLTVPPLLESKLTAAREAIWLRLGALRLMVNDKEGAIEAYERVMKYNSKSVTATTQVGAILAKTNNYNQAFGYLQTAIETEPNNGEAWGVLAYCYLMTNDLAKAYRAYHKSLSNLRSAKDPTLWYGIGILHDRYGCYDLALLALSEVIKLAPGFERMDEVFMCMGIIYKDKQDYARAISCFNQVVRTEAANGHISKKSDALLQLGHVYELQNDTERAIATYRMCLEDNPDSTRTLQQYAWLTHVRGNTAEALGILDNVIASSSRDPHAYYLKARIHTDKEEDQLAFDALNKAISFDGRNPFYWCSIGVLYKQGTQYRDAMNAYTRAIRLNQFVFEVWFNLGVLYETNGQLGDSVDAYRRASELVPDNLKVREALVAAEELQRNSSNGAATREGEGPKSLLPSTNPFAAALREPQQQLHAEQIKQLQMEGDLTLLAENILHRGATAPSPDGPNAVVGRGGDADGMNASVHQPPPQQHGPGWRTHTSVTLDTRGGYSVMPSSLPQSSVDH